MADDTWRTVLWWRVLATIGVGQVVLWCLTAAWAPTADGYAWWHLRLSAVYVAACAYRAVLPRVDLERTTLVDHVASSIFLGRSAATVAEISFGVQTALVVHELGARSGVAALQAAAPAVAVALTVAQAFCWSSVLTLNHLGHAVEESIWAATFAVVAGCAGVAAVHLHGADRAVAVAMAVGALGYVAFMVTVDVPMYLRRWRQGRAAGARYLTVAEGVADAWSRREVTRSWGTWRPEVAWLTGYFSVAVWVSLSYVWWSR